ncbi:hypothetical protein [Clostridium massiliamazoniense]|uniref:hypothetical protein n=1 Tax=Clostridium massiliamazoniense TaxID=1347366 RepID=UPI0006D79B89|nr:hypothetical protein [Clostridium massiliamazoniense]
MKKSVKFIRISSKCLGKGAEYSLKCTGKIIGTAARIASCDKLANNTEKTFNVIGEGLGKGTEITGMGLGYVVDKAFDVNAKRKAKNHKKNNLIVVSRRSLND